MEKTAILGSGNFGANAAAYLAENNVCDVVLVDSKEGTAKGKALDLMEAAPIHHFRVNVCGSDSIDAIAGAKTVVIAAGVSRKQGECPCSLFEANGAVMDTLLADIKRLAPDAVLVIQRDPVAPLVAHAIKAGFCPKKVIGLTGLVESARFSHFMAQELGVSSQDATSIVIGGSGSRAVPLTQYANISGIPMPELFSDAQIATLIEKVRLADDKLLDGLKVLPPYYTPAATLAELIPALHYSQKRILPLVVQSGGAYGLANDVCVALPALIGNGGVEKIIEIELTAQQREALKSAVA